MDSDAIFAVPDAEERLCVDAPPVGKTKLTDCVREQRESLGDANERDGAKGGWGRGNTNRTEWKLIEKVTSASHNGRMRPDS